MSQAPLMLDAPELGQCAPRVTAWRWIALFVTLAIAWRLMRYGLGFPVWGDEAALMLNVTLRQSWRHMLRPLDNYQVAPLGFLLTQFALVRAWGTSEYVLRLLPLVGGVAAVLCFARLAWVALTPVAATFAVGLLCATHYVTRYSLDIKPYGTDLLVASLLLLLAVEWMRRPGQVRWLVALAVVSPVGMLFSFPAVFVAVAVAMALLRKDLSGFQADTLQRVGGTVPQLAEAGPPKRAWAWFAYLAFCLAIGATFFFMLTFSASGQYHQTRNAMVWYWSRGLPPANPLRLLLWLIDVHTAEMMAYPLGDKNGGSTLTLLLVIAGVIALWRQRNWRLLFMLGSIFALTMLAAALRRYPYGGSARVAQHLAPAICLLAGAGVAACIERFPLARRRRLFTICASLLTVCLVGGATRDAVHPFQTADDLRVRRLLVDGWQRHGDANAMWVLDGADRLAHNIRWYLLQGVGWDRKRLHEGPVDPAAVGLREEWWVLGCDRKRAEGAVVVMSGSGFNLMERQMMELPKMPKDSLGRYVELQRWSRVAQASPALALKSPSP